MLILSYGSVDEPLVFQTGLDQTATNHSYPVKSWDVEENKKIGIVTIVAHEH